MTKPYAIKKNVFETFKKMFHQMKLADFAVLISISATGQKEEEKVKAIFFMCKSKLIYLCFSVRPIVNPFSLAKYFNTINKYSLFPSEPVWMLRPELLLCDLSPSRPHN
ncbi:hypothetical protein ILYODFUR_028864 [Ilyodon furcidens]|uniref:Uncharacterized protein n=1 Tax=Ilyodon furcidens TaxID=33524 RepID=A0ABV0TD30_9TELE